MALRRILVVGTGRSGTTTVSRLLSQKCEISMGFRVNEDGEDLDFKDANQALLRNEMPFSVWIDVVLSQIDKRNREGHDWGLKDPRLCSLFGFYRQHIPDAKVIICHRSRGQVVASWVKAYGGRIADVSKIVAFRERMIKAIDADLSLDFSQQRSDDWVLEQLESIGVSSKVLA